MKNEQLQKLKDIICDANSITKFEQCLNEDFIQLEHVLVAIHKKDLVGAYAISSAGIFFRLLDGKVDKYEKWNFSKSGLLDQPLKTQQFLYDILVTPTPEQV